MTRSKIKSIEWNQVRKMTQENQNEGKQYFWKIYLLVEVTLPEKPQSERNVNIHFGRKVFLRLHDDSFSIVDGMLKIVLNQQCWLHSFYVFTSGLLFGWGCGWEMDMVPTYSTPWSCMSNRAFFLIVPKLAETVPHPSQGRLSRTIRMTVLSSPTISAL